MCLPNQCEREKETKVKHLYSVGMAAQMVIVNSIELNNMLFSTSLMYLLPLSLRVIGRVVVTALKIHLEVTLQSSASRNKKSLSIIIVGKYNNLLCSRKLHSIQHFIVKYPVLLT